MKKIRVKMIKKSTNINNCAKIWLSTIKNNIDDIIKTAKDYHTYHVKII